MAGSKRKRGKGGRFRRRGSSNRLGKARRRAPRGKGTRPQYRYKRMETVSSSNANSLQLDTGSTKAGAIDFAFEHVIQNNDFSQLYEFYRIDKVVMSITWGNVLAVTKHETAIVPSAVAVNLTTPDPPGLRFYYVADYDDQISLTEDSMRERQDVRMMSLKPGVTKKITITPAVRTVLWQGPPALPGGNAFIAYGKKFRQWLPFRMNPSDGVVADGKTIPHFGMKFLARHRDVSANGHQGTIQISTEYHFACKSVS